MFKRKHCSPEQKAGMFASERSSKRAFGEMFAGENRVTGPEGGNGHLLIAGSRPVNRGWLKIELQHEAPVFRVLLNLGGSRTWRGRQARA